MDRTDWFVDTQMTHVMDIEPDSLRDVAHRRLLVGRLKSGVVGNERDAARIRETTARLPRGCRVLSN